MKILITGISGLIGSRLKKHYEEGGHEVEGIDKDLNFDIIGGLPDSWKNKKFDLIVHCAAYCRVAGCIKSPSKCFDNNSLITQIMLNYAGDIGCKKFIYFSSSRVLYPNNNPYTASKKYGELLCKAYEECYGIDYIIIRPSTVFGENDNTNRLVPAFIKNAIKNEPLVIYGDNDKTLDLTYIEDFIEAYKDIEWNAKMYDGWNTEWNVGSGVEVNILDLAEFIIDSIKSKSQIFFKESEKSQPQNTLIDVKPLRAIGFGILYGWKLGISKTIAWYFDLK